MPIQRVKNIYSNVHYTTEYDNCIPNKLEEFISLKTSNYDSSPLLKNLEKIIAWVDFILINGEGNIVNHEGPDDKNYRIGAKFC